MQQDPAPEIKPQPAGPPAAAPGDAESALAFWFGRINYEQRTPRPSDLKLERMQALLARLGNPHDGLRIVHVAGSKGKGSTSAMIASVLRRAGHRTGLFTSPHLDRVEERIQVDDEPISGPELTSLLHEVREAVEALDRDGPAHLGAVTFFEVATAVGFLHFARRRVDAAVVEVGLGGRFDSTNVCRPLLSVITSISFDHTRQLGNRLSQIAREKAGIVKSGRPVLSGARGEEACRVIEAVCRERSVPLRRLGAEVRYRHEPGEITADTLRLPRVQVETDRQSWPALRLGLWGDHQAANAALAVAAVEHLRDEGFRIDGRAVAGGLAGVRWPARLEVLGRRPMVVLDCAHNVASAQALVDTLRASFPAHGPGPAAGGKRLLVFAGSSDKDLAGMMRVLEPCFHHIYLTCFADSPRAAAPEQVAALLGGVGGVAWSIHPRAAEAWRAARAAAGPADLVCVTGSVFLAGELRPMLLGECDASQTVSV
jgi:dihydrofolate synthase/folylpolyglutamate synthase